MKINKQQILEKLCYTELVYGRINKKLKSSFSKKEIEVFLFNIIKETDIQFFTKTGKNFYISNLENKIRITINSNTFRVITVDRLKKK